MKNLVAEKTLKQTIEIIKDRGEHYGGVQQNWNDTAKIWNGILSSKLKHEITPADVGMLMIGLKLSRLKNTPDHRDSQIDICGYASLLGEMS